MAAEQQAQGACAEVAAKMCSVESASLSLCFFALLCMPVSQQMPLYAITVLQMPLYATTVLSLLQLCLMVGPLLSCSIVWQHCKESCSCDTKASDLGWPSGQHIAVCHAAECYL